VEEEIREWHNYLKSIFKDVIIDENILDFLLHVLDSPENHSQVEEAIPFLLHVLDSLPYRYELLRNVILLLSTPCIGFGVYSVGEFVHSIIDGVPLSTPCIGFEGRGVGVRPPLKLLINRFLLHVLDSG